MRVSGDASGRFLGGVKLLFEYRLLARYLGKNSKTYQKITKTRKTKQNQAKTHKQQTIKFRQEKLPKTQQTHLETETSRL